MVQLEQQSEVQLAAQLEQQLVRLLAVLCVPGMVLSRLGMAGLDYLVKRRDEAAPKV